MAILNESQASKLITELLNEVDRAMAQRDEFLKTGVSTAGHGGAFDTNFSYILRQNGVIE